MQFLVFTRHIEFCFEVSVHCKVSSELGELGLQDFPQHAIQHEELEDGTLKVGT